MAGEGSPSEIPPRSGAEERYEGESGRTRLETLHLPAAGGGMTVVRVYRAVNVATHPELREKALTGALHSVAGGPIAISFIYHDPIAQKFALVVPSVLRHEAMRERGRLIARLADETRQVIPSYVGEATTVVGLDDLRKYIGLRGPMPLVRALRTEEPAPQRDPTPSTSGEELYDVSSMEVQVTNGRGSTLPPGRDLDTIAVGLAEVSGDDVLELDGSGTNPRLIDEELSEEVESIVEADEVEELKNSAPERDEITGMNSMPNLPFITDFNDGKTSVGDSSREELAPRTDSAVDPPASFLSDPSAQLAPVLADDDELHVFLRCPSDHKGGFERGADLLVQLVDGEGVPIVVLTMIEQGVSTSPLARRIPLDPSRTETRAILESLRRDFSAVVHVLDTDGAPLRVFEVHGNRAVNVAMVLDRATRSEDSASIDMREVLERVSNSPPPIDAPHPFRPEALRLESARETHEAVEELSRWSTPDRMEHALLVLSVPRDVIDAATHAVISAAIDHGIAVPGALVQRGLALGVTEDAPSLISGQLRQFLQTIGDPRRGGLSAEQVAENWEQLLEAAAAHDVVVDKSTHEIAWRSIRSVRKEQPAPLSDNVDLAKLKEMGAPQLVMLLEHPRARRAAALEVCRRGDPAMLESLYRSVRKMPRNEVVRVVPRVLDFGEAGGDVLLDGLTARKTFVRQASSLALGQLKLRRAVFPLVHLLQTEPSDVWREVARVLGSFGPPALRSVTRGLRDPKGNEERYAWTLAYLANHGGDKAVAKLTHDRDAKVAAVAEEALMLRDVASRQEEVVLGRSQQSPEDPVEQFSRRFYEELEGRAPERELEDVVD